MRGCVRKMNFDRHCLSDAVAQLAASRPEATMSQPVRDEVCRRLQQRLRGLHTWQMSRAFILASHIGERNNYWKVELSVRGRGMVPTDCIRQ